MPLHDVMTSHVITSSMRAADAHGAIRTHVGLRSLGAVMQGPGKQPDCYQCKS
jgi:hypothetical protein